MEKQYFNEYPYGHFPSKFTKSGQKQLFEELNTNNTPPKISVQNQQINEPAQPQNSFDIAKLLPLLKMMGDKKSISSTDMLQMFIPMLGGNASNLSEIMSLKNPPKSTIDDTVEDIPLTSSIKIEEYKRVE